MKFVKVTAGRHHAWFMNQELLVRRPYIPPEGCHRGCGLVGEGQVIKPPAPEKIKIEPVQAEVKLSWWRRLMLFIKRFFGKND